MAKPVIRVGIAGQGRSGYGIHARYLCTAGKQYQIAAVSDELADRRKEAREQFGCRTYADWREMLQDGDFDLLVNSLPSNLHPKGTIAGLRRGYHVVCEKPIAVKVADFDKMVAAAKQAKRVFAPFQNSRFWPYFAKVREVIASGVLGKILHIRLVWSGFKRRWDWQTRQDLWGGNLNNTGPHPMDQAVILFGSKMPKVFAQLRSEEGSYGDADDFAAVTLYGGKDDPVIEVLVSSYLAYGPDYAMTVCGTRGNLQAGPGVARWQYYNANKAPRHHLQEGWSQGRHFCSEKLPWTKKSWKRPAGDNFQTLSAGFYNNLYDVLTGKGKLIVQPAEVRRQVAVLEECHRQNRLPKGKKTAKKKARKQIAKKKAKKSSRRK